MDEESTEYIELQESRAIFLPKVGEFLEILLGTAASCINGLRRFVSSAGIQVKFSGVPFWDLQEACLDRLGDPYAGRKSR